MLQELALNCLQASPMSRHLHKQYTVLCMVAVSSSYFFCYSVWERIPLFKCSLLFLSLSGQPRAPCYPSWHMYRKVTFLNVCRVVQTRIRAGQMPYSNPGLMDRRATRTISCDLVAWSCVYFHKHLLSGPDKKLYYTVWLTDECPDWELLRESTCPDKHIKLRRSCNWSN